MSTEASNQDLGLITQIIARHPSGIGIAALEDELAQMYQVRLNRRTLQRRLRKLLEQGDVSTTGASAAVVYRIERSQGYAQRHAHESHASHDGQVALAMPPEPLYRRSFNRPRATVFRINEPENYVTLSPEGSAIRDYVRRPLMHRQPVGYQLDFLAGYEPGKTLYLPLELREHLHEIGRTGPECRLAGTYARDVLDRLLVDLSWASSRLEGNTYSRLDTQRLIALGEVASDKDAWQAQMILNHKAAIELLVEDADVVGVDRPTFLSLHALLAEDLLADQTAAGRLRRRPVDISGSVFVPLAIPQMVEACFEEVLAKARAIEDPFEQAFFLMVHLPYLQPFEDVNKRVSRIGANLPFIKHNLCPLSFIDVPERAYFEGLLGIYELNQIELMRDVFVWAYQRSSQQYLAVTESTKAPDRLKLKYRTQLRQAVASIVRNHQRPTPEVFWQYAHLLAESDDGQRFVQLLSEMLGQLHEYTAARYRLRPSEVVAWWQAVKDNS